MKKAALISLLFLLGGCTIHLKSDTKQDENNVCTEKEIYMGPQIGKN